MKNMYPNSRRDTPFYKDILLLFFQPEFMVTIYAYFVSIKIKPMGQEMNGSKKEFQVQV